MTVELNLPWSQAKEPRGDQVFDAAKRRVLQASTPAIAAAVLRAVNNIERDSIAPSQRERAVSPKLALDAQIASDQDYAWSWHCNLAVPIMESAGISHTKANDIAASLMRDIFGTDTRLNPNYQVAQEPDERVAELSAKETP